MNFVHNLFEAKRLERIEKEGQRLYVTEEGNQYPSVTTVLSWLSRKHIDRWKAAVGHEVANRISSGAARNGTAVHNVAEKYVLNDPTWKDAMPIAVEQFLRIKPYLDENVSEIYGVELQMYSNELQVAGTADLICKYNGKPTLLDFKTSRRKKSKEDILSYFLQACAYSQMVKEHYDMDIEQIVILMAVADDEPLVFVEPIESYMTLAQKYFKFYQEGKLN
jgi:ATP-dependent exoDNAse (exonuclease V) beta subunit